jgi:hypothetical protein
MRAGLSFSRSSISLLLRQPLSIKKSYAGAIQVPQALGSHLSLSTSKGSDLKSPDKFNVQEKYMDSDS